MGDLTETIAASQVGVGDLVSLPGSSVHQSRVQMVRSAVPGVVWLYLIDSQTGERRRGHVALPVNQTLLRHRAGPATSLDWAPEDS